MAKDIVLGIDLGTTFTSAAAWVEGKVYTVPDMRGEPCIPSIVYFAEGGVPVVGSYAEKMLATDPTHTIAGIKVVLGRAYDSPEYRRLAALSCVSMKKAENGSIILKTRSGEQTPIDVASYIFQHLKELAEKRFRLPITKAVITVPATATPEVEAATIRAAQMVGLEVLRTLSEPVAGAYAYGIERFKGQRKLLAYDFGGGTFDVTLLEQIDQHITPLALGGDSCLGGDDFDQALAQMAASYVWSAHHVDLTRDPILWHHVRLEAEKLKRGLSTLEAASLRLKNAYTVRGVRQDLKLNVTRRDVEPHWGPLVERSLRSTAAVLKQCKMRPEDIQLLLLIGGTTYIPMVRKMIGQLMKREGYSPGDPQIAVAWGAAVEGARVLRLAA